jgi:hypothetical protein
MKAQTEKAQTDADLTLLQVCSAPPGHCRNPRLASGSVALLTGPRGPFGWRLTRRQAAALDQAGLASRP